jgi:serine/threonine protein kinase
VNTGNRDLVDQTTPRHIGEGRYLLVRTIASGGMGKIWEGRDTRLNRTVAIKEVSLDQVSPVQRTDFLARAEQEGRSAASLDGHPNIVAVYDVVIEDGMPWTVMQLVRGRSLADALEAGPLPLDTVIQIAKQMLSALEYVHASGIVHRDVKPPNIMLDDAGGRAVLTDFGIAKSSDTLGMTQTGLVLGSAPYLAPERLEGQADGPPSDLFSLGVTLFEAVEGFAPFSRDTWTGTVTAILVKPLPAMRHAGHLEPLIRTLADKDPDRRPTVAQALAMLDGAASSGTVPGRGSTPADPAPLRATAVGVPTPRPSSSESVFSRPPGAVLIRRIAGSDRYGTSIAISQSHWADRDGDGDGDAAEAVVLATSAGFAAALAAAPLAAHVSGPLLVTEQDRLTPAIEQEIRRILPAHPERTVYLLGGTGVLSQSVADRVTALGYRARRLGGTDRYATARAIADQLGARERVVVATGHDFADALVAGPLAAALGAAILLSDGPVLDPDTAAYVRRALATAPSTAAPGGPSVITVGGDASRAVQEHAGATPWLDLSGADRYATAAAVASRFPEAGGSVRAIGIATAKDHADALAGGALMAALGNPLLLTDVNAPPPRLSEAITSQRWHDLTDIVLFGGEGAISSQAESQIAQLVGGGDR